MKKIFTILLIAFSATTINAQSTTQSEYMVLAEEAIKDKNPYEAITYYEKEIDVNPQNGYAHFWLGFYYQGLYQEYETALTYLDDAIKYTPKNDDEIIASIYHTSAICHYCIGNYSEAVKFCEKHQSLRPNDLYTLHIQAESHKKLGQKEKARAIHLKLYELAPHSHFEHYNMGEWAYEDGDFLKAEKFYYQAFLLTNEYKSLNLGKCIDCNIKVYDYKAALELLQALLLIDPTQAEDFYNEIAQKDFLLTIASLSNIKDADIKALTYYILGSLFQNYEDYEKAIASYEEHLRTAKDPLTITFLRLMTCYESVYEDEKALEYVNHCININPQYTDNTLNKSNILCSLGRFDEALEYVNQYIEKSNASYTALFLRARIYNYMKDYENAIKDFSALIDMEESSAGIYSLRGHAYLQQGNNEMAQKDFDKAISMYEAQEEYDFNITMAYIGTGNYERALEIAEEAYDYYEKDNLYNTACIYALMNDSENALKFLEMAVNEKVIHIELAKSDPDLQSIRHLPRYNEIINSYKK